MRTFRLTVALGLAGGLCAGTFNASAYHEVDASVEIRAEAEFHAPLAEHGRWIEVDGRRCWHPARVEVGWRPYCYGSWVWTDCGWYWVSDEPWAWACYHYGRWSYHPRYAWVWYPDTVWGPSWVCWREGGGYVGWAPLPPYARFQSGVIVVTDVSPSLYVFVDFHRFHERHRPSAVIVNDTKIVNKTVNITKIKQVEKTIVKGGPKKVVVVNEGPSFENVEKASGKKVRTEDIRTAAQQAAPPPSVKRKEIQRQEKQDQPVRELQPDKSDRPERPAKPEKQERMIPAPAPEEKAAPPPREKVRPREKESPGERVEPKEAPREKIEPNEKTEPNERSEPKDKAGPREKHERRDKAEPAPQRQDKREPAPEAPPPGPSEDRGPGKEGERGHD